VEAGGLNAPAPGPSSGREGASPVSPAPVPREKPQGLSRLWKSCANSWKGFVGAFREEAAFRQELAAGVVLVPLAIWLGRTGIERALLLGSLLLVLIVELLNSAVEATVDRIGPERHSLSGLAKDIGSAAVALALLNVVVVWGFVLFG
jgi:diacylglycerol kinase (ATP)